MSSLSIGDVAARAGLRTSAVRYYERIGLLPAPARTSGRRRYGADVIDRLTVIRFARDSGFTLREIRVLFGGRPYSAKLRAMATDKIGALDEAVAEIRAMQSLLRAALRCDCLSLEECGRRIRGSGKTRPARL